MVVTTLKLPDPLHYLVGIAAALKKQSAHAWALAAIEETLQRQARQNPLLAAAIKRGDRAATTSH